MQEVLGVDACIHVASFLAGKCLLETSLVNRWSRYVVHDHCETVFLARLREDFFPCESSSFVATTANLLNHIPLAWQRAGLDTGGKAWKAWAAWQVISRHYRLETARNGAYAYLRGFHSWHALKEAYRALPEEYQPFAREVEGSLQEGVKISLPAFLSLLQAEGALGQGFGRVEGEMENVANLFGLFVHHNGQREAVSGNMQLGILGGHTIYRRYVNGKILDLSSALLASTEASTEKRGLVIVMCISVLAYPRFVRFNCHNGRVEGRVEGRHDIHNVWCPLITEAAGKSTLFDWIDGFSSRLKEGVFRVDVIPRGPGQGMLQVSHFPCKGPNYAERITNGICVRVSMMRVFDYSAAWAYEISVRVIPQGEEGHVPVEVRGYDVAQLVSRSYDIPMAGDRANQRVWGEAVTGYYPAIRDKAFHGDAPGSHSIAVDNPQRIMQMKCEAGLPGWFIFQSALPEGCLGLTGYFTFVPGFIPEPTGPPFKVHLPSLIMEDPGISWYAHGMTVSVAHVEDKCFGFSCMYGKLKTRTLVDKTLALFGSETAVVEHGRTQA